MVTENWVTNHAEDDAKNTKQHSQHFWYQVSREGKLIKQIGEKSDFC